MPTVELRVVDPDGNRRRDRRHPVRSAPRPDDHDARATGTGPTRPTTAVLPDGWFRTGDIGRLDDDGFLYLVDRAKDMIIRAGENVYCVEIEQVLFEHPDVVDAAVVGVPHKELGEEVKAVVQLRARLERRSATTIRALVRGAPRELQGAGVRRAP